MVYDDDTQQIISTLIEVSVKSRQVYKTNSPGVPGLFINQSNYNFTFRDKR